MSKRFYISRLKNYIKNKGFKSTSIRLIEKSKHMLFKRRFNIYHANIANFSSINSNLPASMVIVRKANEDEIESHILESLCELRQEKIVMQQFQERFPKGALLWILTINGDLAGFMWSIRRSPIEHFFFPLMDNDVYFFDIMILLEQRNKNLFPLFMHSVLSKLKHEGISNGYYTTYEWNKQMIKSTTKTAFQKIGMAQKFHMLGKDVVLWSEMTTRNKPDYRFSDRDQSYE